MCSRRYGYEGILQHVFRKSLNKWQVHVSPATENLCLAELQGCTSSDPAQAMWIHACQPAMDKVSRGEVKVM